METPVIVLVHGTFARGAEWATSRGVVRTALREVFGQDAVIRTFPWSGGNSHRDRFAGAEALSAFAAALAAEYPNRPLVFVAHSHGGNVALWAITIDSALRERVAVICCLGTPFITAGPLGSLTKTLLSDLSRSYFDDLNVLVGALSAYGGAATGLWLAVRAWTATFSIIRFGPVFGLMSVIALTTGGFFAGGRLGQLFLAAVERRRERVTTHATTLGEQTANHFEYEIGGTQLHVFRVDRDEASLWLSLWDGLTSTLRDWPARITEILMTVSAVGAAGAIIAHFFEMDDNPFFVLSIVFLLFGPVAVVLWAFVATGISYLYRRSFLTYGENLTTTALAAVKTTSLPPVPPLNVTDHQVTIGRKHRVLRHSAICTDPAVAAEVAAAVVAGLKLWPSALDRAREDATFRREFSQRVARLEAQSSSLINANRHHF